MVFFYVPLKIHSLQYQNLIMYILKEKKKKELYFVLPHILFLEIKLAGITQIVERSQNIAHVSIRARVLFLREAVKLLWGLML